MKLSDGRELHIPCTIIFSIFVIGGAWLGFWLGGHKHIGLLVAVPYFLILGAAIAGEGGLYD